MRVFDNVRCRTLGLTATMGILLLVGLTAGASAAPLLFNENFNYPVGNLVGNDGWTQTGTVTTSPIQVTASNLTYTGYPNGTYNAVTLATGQDANAPFSSAVTSGIVYSSFLVNVTAASTTANGDYFYEFNVDPSNSFDFFARVYGKRDASNNLAFGIQKKSITPATFTGFAYSMGVTYLMVIGYQFNEATTTDDIVYLWINPARSCDRPAWTVSQTNTDTDALSLGAIGVRQGGGATYVGCVVDGIRVSTDWAKTVWGGCGACCDEVTGSCEMTIPYFCDYSWLGDLVPCDDCVALTGACCAPSGLCTITTEPDCAGLGTWHGEWTSCDPTPYGQCPQPLGACCDPQGFCTMTTQAECESERLGVWHGDWTSCDPLPYGQCPLPVGACCAPEGYCTMTLQADCVGPSIWHGDWTSCEPLPYGQCPVPPPMGACCDPSNGYCYFTTEAECPLGFVWHGDWLTCEPLPFGQCPVPPPVGACCDPITGFCTMTTEADCVTHGIWHGDWLTCDPLPYGQCPLPMGACCAPDGFCTMTTQADCLGHGIWHGDWTTCDPLPYGQCPVPPPTGACCDPTTGYCTMTTQVDCADPKIWHGDWLTCEPLPYGQCPPPVPTKDATWGQIKSNYR